MKKIYPAIFEEDPVGYGVYFPNVEGAVTQGKTLEEAMENASDALGIMLASMIENEEKLPTPTNINEVSKENVKLKIAFPSPMISEVCKIPDFSCIFNNIFDLISECCNDFIIIDFRLDYFSNRLDFFEIIIGLSDVSDIYNTNIINLVETLTIADKLILNFCQ